MRRYHVYICQDLLMLTIATLYSKTTPLCSCMYWSRPKASLPARRNAPAIVSRFDKKAAEMDLMRSFREASCKIVFPTPLHLIEVWTELRYDGDIAYYALLTCKSRCKRGASS